MLLLIYKVQLLKYRFMITNALFQQCLASIPNKEKMRFERSFEIAERLEAIMKEKNLSVDRLAKLVGKRKPQIESWLSGRHYFSTDTIKAIENVLNCKIV